ncbi:hypothetical protein HK414_19040 [Ramlibacter terrae]|uniref:Uncharacterized protein n=1 Tax=Ramlibacter terrae TaxID=2732511 RepID=A0ABX6P2F3_9BURK|nr:hypothetical protein HK414_19040 [Ramlibacter terrae]
MPLAAVRAGGLVEKLRFQDLLTMGGRIFHQTHRRRCCACRARWPK